ncbi:MAG TPA: hypothetical protein VFO31_26970, partial [Vicinamibacterales bacterium]|nr:hypothetical protein [Vicinamibacterales bacterium]
MNRTPALAILAGLMCVSLAGLRAQTAAESRNVVLVAQNDLNGNGDGGEGLALQQFPDGRKILYLAHEAPQRCLSVIDVTKPEAPVMVNQLPSPSPGVTRCNSLGLSGTVLAVANQAAKAGGKTAGMWVLDVSSFERIQSATSLDDLKLSFFDTSGPHSRGVHNLWFVDGEFAHLTTGMADFTPTHEQDDQIWVTVDLRDPRKPREVGRWWLPGTRKGDRCLPGCLPKRHAPFDDGYRPHQIEIWPDHPDRAYVAYIDGGAMIFDVSGLAQVKSGRAARYTPRLIGRREFHPPFPAWTHTFQPMFARKLAWASDEDVMDNCKDAPKLVWLLDIRDETNPVIVATAPLHPNDGELCARGGRFGAHNIHPNFPGPLYANLQNTTVSTWFNGGVRIYRAVEGPKGVADVPPQI